MVGAVVGLAVTVGPDGVGVAGFLVGVAALVGVLVTWGVIVGADVAVGGGEVNITFTSLPAGIGDTSVFLRRRKNPTASARTIIKIIIATNGILRCSFIINSWNSL